MSFNTLRQLVESRLAANWATTDIVYDNINYTPGDNPWIRVTVLDGESNQITMESSPLYRAVGIIQIDVFTKENTGSGVARGYADTIAGIFRGWKSSGLTVRAPSIERIGVANGWYQVAVTCPFYYDAQF